MSQFEAARIKILDKNTRQVIKEIDALTSDEAVYCDEGTITLKDKLEDLSKKAAQSATSITNITQNYDENFTNIDRTITNNTNDIQLIKQKNIAYDQKFIDIDDSISEINTSVTDIKNDITEMKTEMQSNKQKLDDEITLIKDINTEQNGKISSIIQKNLDQDSSIAAINGNISTINSNISTMKNSITSLTNRGAFYVAASAPSAARKNDLWIDTANNIIKVKLSTGWKGLSAVWNA